MKKLLVLLLLWLGLTVQLGLANLKLEDRSQNDMQHRAFIAYYSTFAGCLEGSKFAVGSWDGTYSECRELAFSTKEGYLKR